MSSLLVPALYVAGLGLALLVQRTDAFNGVLRAIFFLPQMVSLVVVALVWQVLRVEKIGVVNRLLAPLGLGGVSCLGDPELALFAVVFVSVWFLMGFYMLIFLGGLQDIPGNTTRRPGSTAPGRSRASVHHPAASPADKLLRRCWFDW